ncbi:hypothetical protein EKO04_009752 [Ascochyta lentis]|uniref:Uncharacterized protein n=1 Tax=Ascochyta lentis TaxID=205686 RepID=A0A8H7IWL0_9PLEO|nr:hypothetical protein EKO04_009752 [Ascochyta lentis]
MPATTNPAFFKWWEVALFLVVAFIWVQILLFVLRFLVDWQITRARETEQRERRAALAAAAQQDREWLEMMNGHRFQTAIQAQEPATPVRRGAESRAQLRRELEADLAKLEEMDKQNKDEE